MWFGESKANCSFRSQSNVILCASPPLNRQGTVQVFITLEQSKLHLQSPLHFNYFVVPTVKSLYPSSGPWAGGGLVRVRGTNFVTQPTYCVFGEFKSRVVAMILTSSEMMCTAPSSMPSLVSLLMSSNGQEYSIEEPWARHTHTEGFSIVSIQPSVMITGEKHSLTILGGPSSDTGVICVTWFVV